MLEIAIQAVPAQTVSVVLGSQNVQIALNQKPQGIFVDINVDSIDVSLAVIALDSVPLNSRGYASFSGNLFLVDTEGSDDPVYTGLGDRWRLVYLTADEMVSYGFVQ